MKYYLEGNVFEITKTMNENSFQIIGTEGYCLSKHKENIIEKCNVLCEYGKIVQENKKPIHSLKIPIDFKYVIDDSFLSLLITAMLNGKKVRILIEENKEGEIQIDSKSFSIFSVTILAE